MRRSCREACREWSKSSRARKKPNKCPGKETQLPEEKPDDQEAVSGARARDKDMT